MVRSMLASWKWQLHLAWLFTSQDCFHTCLIALSEPELSSTNLTLYSLVSFHIELLGRTVVRHEWPLPQADFIGQCNHAIVSRKFPFWIQKYGSWQRLMLFLVMRYQCDNVKVRVRSEAFKLFPNSPFYFCKYICCIFLFLDFTSFKNVRTL